MTSVKAGSGRSALLGRSGASAASARAQQRHDVPPQAEPLPIKEAAASSASLARDALFRRLLLFADVVAITGAFVLTVALARRSVAVTWEAIVGLPILIVGAKSFGLYDRDEALLRKTTLEEAPKLFQLATLCALVAWLADGLIIRGTLSRHEALILWLALAALLIVARKVSRTVALRIAPPERCLLIGSADAARTIRSKLSGHSGIRATMAAHVELDAQTPWASAASPSERHAMIRELVRSLDIHRAIVAPSSADAGEILDLVSTLKAVGARVSVLPRLLEVVGSSVEFDDLHGVTVMGVRRFELSRSSALLKRAFDLFGALAGLIAISPIMIAIVIAIKLDSRGPIFFKQLRVGRHGERFHMLKFRTMVAGADEMKDSLRDRNEAQAGLFKIADDPRITRVGRFLRKSALDELPQLINVMRGEMSLVGPRPLIVEEDEMVEGRHRQRLRLTPGITGLWQILGPTRVSLLEMVAIDYLYVANWSLWGDVKVLLRTIPYVFGRQGM